MLANLSVKDFLAKTAGNDPVPGGGSISALNAALASALTEMVTNLTIGRKKYADKEELMTKLCEQAKAYQVKFVEDIDADADAYNKVFASFKMPKETEQEQTIRKAKIQEATIYAAEVPMRVATEAFAMMEIIEQVAEHGNQNAITDACVAMMAARTAVLGALLNVRINLGSINDQDFVTKMKNTADDLEKKAIAKEQALLTKVVPTL